MEKQAKANQPFFLWYNSTAMHFRTHVADKNRGKSGQDDYSDRMVVHDEQIGQMLNKLDELGIADNTIVMYSTDNGPENDTWPDGANTPVPRPEGHRLGGRLARAVLHPLAGQDQGGHDAERHLSRTSTCCRRCWPSPAMPEVTEKCLNGYKVGGHDLQGPSRRPQPGPYLTGQAKESPRSNLMYFSDDGDVIAVRVGDYKFHLAVQRANTMDSRAEPFVKLRVPHIMNLRRDPFERAEFNSNTYWDWMVNHVPQMYLMQDVVACGDRELRQVPAAPEAGVVQS